jgi:ABC-2 type transport system ATP-binding protein
VSTAIEVEQLGKRYGSVHAISQLSFSVQSGQVVGLLGPNGAGKTTTMRILAGSLGASEGSATVGGFDVFESPRQAKRRLGYLPELPPLYGDMTVVDYLTYAGRLKGVEKPRAAVDRAMSQVGITDVAGRLIGHLSKGYRQRVGLGQALVHDPDVLLLDEPMSGLDPAQQAEIRKLIQTLAAGDRTVMLSTHSLAQVEAICQRAIIVNGGRIVADLSLEDDRLEVGTVTLRVARPEPALEVALAATDGVVSVESGSEGCFVVRVERDIRPVLARVAAEYELLELIGRERLESIYLRVTAGAPIGGA